MDDDVLPFVLEYGAWIWKVALVALVALVVGAVHLLRRRAAKKAALDATRQLARDANVVRGTLRGSDGDLVATLVARIHDLASPVEGADGSPTTTTWHAREVYLDTEQGRVTLDGPIEVIAGSSTTVTRSGVPAETRDDHFEAAKAKASWVHRPHEAPTTTGTATLLRLRAGDAIVATGVLEPAPAKEESGYRDNASAWVLRADGERPIRIAAIAPAPEFARLSILAMIVLAGVTAGIGYGAMRGLGGRWQRQCADSETAGDITNTHPCSLAAATPKRKRDAMSDLLWRLDRAETPPNAHKFALVMALSKRAESCNELVDRMDDHYRYDEAIAEARRCGDRRAEHIALVSDARFVEAAKIHVPGEEHVAELPTVPTLIAAGEWTRAAAGVDRVVVDLQNRPLAEGESSRNPSIVHYRCIAELLRHHGGDAGALARMRKLYEGPDGRACTPMLGEIVAADERAKLWQTDDDEYPLFDTRRIVSKLAWATASEPSLFAFDSPEEALVQPNDMGSTRELPMVWLVDLDRERVLASHDARSVHALRWLALARTLDGDQATAIAHAKEAMEKALAPRPRADSFAYRDVPHLLAAVELYGSTTTAPVNFDNPPGVDGEFAAMMKDNWLHSLGRLLLRAGKPIDAAYFGPRDEYKEALAEAARGNGKPLARAIGGRLNWWSDGDVMAVLPRLKEGRAEVIEAVRYARKSYSSASGGSLDYHYPFSLVGVAVERRGLLQIAGLPGEAKRWDDMYRRLDAVFADRKKLVALMIWSE